MKLPRQTVAYIRGASEKLRTEQRVAIVAWAKQNEFDVAQWFWDARATAGPQFALADSEARRVGFLILSFEPGPREKTVSGILRLAREGGLYGHAITHSNGQSSELREAFTAAEREPSARPRPVRRARLPRRRRGK